MIDIGGVPSVVIPECAKASTIRSTIDPNKPDAAKKRAEADEWLAKCKAKIEKLKGLESWAVDHDVIVTRANMDDVISQVDSEVHTAFIEVVDRIAGSSGEEPHYVAVMLRGVGLPVDFSDDLTQVTSQNADQFFVQLPEAEATVSSVAGKHGSSAAPVVAVVAAGIAVAIFFGTIK